MSSAISPISSVPIPCVVTAGLPTRIPEAMLGGCGSYGMAFLFSTMPAASQRASASAPVTPIALEVEQREVGVGAAGDGAHALLDSRPSVSAWALAMTCWAYCWYSAVAASLQRHRLGRHRVHERAALHHREDRLVDGLGVLGLGRRSCRRAGPRRTLCVVKVTTSA